MSQSCFVALHIPGFMPVRCDFHGKTVVCIDLLVAVGVEEKKAQAAVTFLCSDFSFLHGCGQWVCFHASVTHFFNEMIWLGVVRSPAGNAFISAHEQAKANRTFRVTV